MDDNRSYRTVSLLEEVFHVAVAEVPNLEHAQNRISDEMCGK